MSTDPNAPAGNTDKASTKHLPEHPEITSEEAARLVTEDQGFDEEGRDELAAQYREHVLDYGP